MRKLIPYLFSAFSSLGFMGAQSEVKPRDKPPAIIDAIARKISEKLPDVPAVIARVFVAKITNKYGHSRKLNKKIMRYRLAV